jgi:uncharacterized protein (DUF1684 family)
MTEANPPRDFDQQQHEREVQSYRQARLKRLTSPDGWLSLIGKDWLVEGENSVGSSVACTIHLPQDKAPSSLFTLTLSDGKVRLAPTSGRDLTLRMGATSEEIQVHAPILLASDQNGTPDRVCFGSLTFELMQRGDAFALRTRDNASEKRTNFPGIPCFPIDPSWRVLARFERFAAPKTVQLQYETGDAENYRCEGCAIFERDGVTYRVEPVIDGSRPRLFLLFWDRTAKNETYGAGRFLYAPLPENDEVVFDFNQAFNPPCAFTPFASCPLPPPENRLALRVEAGERKPLE